MKILICLLGVVLLAGCPRPPVVSDIRHDMAKIQVERVLLGDTVARAKQLQAEADRACGIYGRIASQKISSRCIRRDPFWNICTTDEALFACAPADGED